MLTSLALAKSCIWSARVKSSLANSTTPSLAALPTVAKLVRLWLARPMPLLNSAESSPNMTPNLEMIDIIIYL